MRVKAAGGKQIFATASQQSNEGPLAGGQAEAAFRDVLGLIRSARRRVLKAANAEVIDLYWHIGQFLHHRIESDGWAKGTVVQLAAYIATREPGRRGFSAQNLWRMRQFFQTYPGAYAASSKLSTLLREIPWSAHLHIQSRAKHEEEREFYLRMTVQQRWQVCEVARQIDNGLFEQAVLNPPKISTALRASQPEAAQYFKDAYQLEFLALPDLHSESDLHRGLLMNLGRFLTELGRDFCYIGSEYPLQVGATSRWTCCSSTAA